LAQLEDHRFDPGTLHLRNLLHTGDCFVYVVLRS